jgi:hypothetical protein
MEASQDTQHPLGAGETQGYQPPKPPRPAIAINIDIRVLEASLSSSSGYQINVDSQALRRVLTDLKQHVLYTRHLQAADATRVEIKENAILRDIQEELKNLSNKIAAKQPEKSWATVASQGTRQENARVAQAL